MMSEGERARDAARVVTAAERVLREPDTTAGANLHDLAALLAAIGKAWSSQTATEALIESYRWSEVCITAERVAGRLLRERSGRESEPAPAMEYAARVIAIHRKRNR